MRISDGAEVTHRKAESIGSTWNTAPIWIAPKPFVNVSNKNRPILLSLILLDEVHWLHENHQIRFALCGSSARTENCVPMSPIT